MIKSHFHYFSKYPFLLPIAGISLFLTGCFCESSPTLPTQDTNHTSILENIPVEYSDVYDIGIPKQTGQSAISKISLEEFQQITPEALSTYLDTCISCTHHDWHALVIDSNTAVFYAYTLEHPIYGIWDANEGITQILGDYLPSSEPSYELSLR